MRYWLNVANTQFDLMVNGSAEQIVGTLIHCDETGCTIKRASDGAIHSYALVVVQHACVSGT